MTDVEREKLAYQSLGVQIGELERRLETKRAALTTQMDSLIAEWEAANKAEMDELKDLTEKRESVEEFLRSSAIKHYAETGTKSLDEHLGVRVNTKLVYKVEDAVEWAEKNAPVMIVKGIDKKPFEAIASDKHLDFVKVEEKVTAVIKGL